MTGTIMQSPTTIVRLAAVSISLCIPAFAAAPLSAQERGADSASAPAARSVELNGFVSTSYSYNFNRPSSGLNDFRVFDFDDGDFKVDVAELVLQKTAAHAGQGGFRVDAELGASIPRVSAAAGLFRDSGGSAQDIDLQQAFVSYIVPLGRGLRVDVGKFVTPAGCEVIEGYDGYNDEATRSFLFGYAIPFTHTGLRLSYPFSSRVALTVMGMNGWDNVRDNNRAKSGGAQLLVTPVDGLTLSLVYIGGAERSDDDADLRQLVDFCASWSLTDWLSVGVNGDYGTEAAATAGGGDAVWNGAAGYLKVAVADPFTIALRGEFFQDRDGLRTGLAQKLAEVTLTPAFRLADNVLLRADLRLDRSNKKVFDKGGEMVKSQATVLFNGIYSF
jgi:hypothetical protein